VNYVFRPKELEIGMLRFVPEARIESDRGCRKGEASIFNTVRVINECFSYKFRVTLNCRLDCADALDASFCDDKGVGKCPHARLEKQFAVPAAISQQYWAGAEKAVSVGFCWADAEKCPDMNLSMDITVTSLSQSTDSAEGQALSGSSLLNAYFTRV
jgi:hypothetical protein